MSAIPNSTVHLHRSPSPDHQMVIIASRVLTLPTYYGLPLEDVKAIAKNVLEIVG